MRKETKNIPAFTVASEYHIDSLLDRNEGAYELEMELVPGTSEVAGFKLFNGKGEKVNIYLNLTEGKLVMDRTKSGVVDFGRNSKPHALEAHDKQMAASINYIDDFSLATWAPLAKATSHKLNIFVDKCSVEIFLDGGRIAMTNLVFPNEPYNRLSFYAKGGNFDVTSFQIYKLGL